ncbi:MAG: excinuclease ABC subunit A, partial [Bacteroidales bacterium]|nr:excinuclease ABC subunit A [Bacteroidales bacterium]
MLIKGARVNNLKNITIEIPRGKLVVVTGVSGSGKSSLAFDTLFAEGQRRFAESLSSYARQFLGRMSKPDVDGIEDIPPAIAIEQKVNIKNPRSTVATTTEVYDYLRLIFARIGRTFSPVSGREVRKQGVGDVVDYLSALEGYEAIYILADLQWKDRSDRTELLLQLKEDGYNRLWADGAPVKIEDLLKSGTDPEDAWLLVDRFRDLSDRTRLLGSISDAFSRGN